MLLNLHFNLCLPVHRGGEEFGFCFLTLVVAIVGHHCIDVVGNMPDFYKTVL